MKVVLSYYNMFEVANIRKPDYTFNCNLSIISVIFNNVLICLKSGIFISILLSFRCSKVAFNCRWFEWQFILTLRLNTVYHSTNVVARQHESSWVRLSLLINQLCSFKYSFVFLYAQSRCLTETDVGEIPCLFMGCLFGKWESSVYLSSFSINWLDSFSKSNSIAQPGNTCTL